MIATELPLKKTLINRLDPEIEKKMYSIATKYPTVFRMIRDALSKEDNYMGLNYATVSLMGTYLGIDINYLNRVFH